MKAVEITKTNFNEVLSKNSIVILDFWAGWCGPCKAFAPVFEKVATKNPDVVFGKINTENEAELAEAFKIRSIPTVMAFRDNIMLLSQPGALSENGLEDLISQIKELDMEKLKKEGKV